MTSENSDERADREGQGEEVESNSDKTTPDAFGETMAMPGETAASTGAASERKPEDWIGRRLGKYEITGVLGVGGMGVVLAAHDTSIERNVAIKVLPAELSSDEIALGRFFAEAKSAGKLSHPNTVTIYEISQEGDTCYLVMELVSGGSAEDKLQRQGACSVSEATRMVIEACQGLSAAHDAGLVHRDIKPANLLLTKDGTVKVSDFGLAKRTQNQTLQMTKVGQIIGTPYYMSPEQCESREADARSDVYSLGATYYGLLTGKNPYSESGSVVQVMYSHCNADPPDPREIRTDVPAACAQIIERAMAKRPEQRYQTAAEMRVDLEAVLAAMSGAGIALPSQSGVRQADASAGSSKTGLWLVAAGLALMFVGIIAGAALLKFNSGSPDRDPTGPGAVASNTGPAESEAADPVTIAPTSGEPIRIGILHSLSGTMSDSESPVVDAVLLAVEELNRGGGLLGRPIEPVVADGRSDSEVFVREARRLISEEQVCTVFGCWTSASRKTVVPVFEELDHLLIYPVQYEGIEESPNVVYVGAAPNQQIIPAVKWAFAFDNRRKFFFVGSDYVFPRVANEIIKDQLGQLGAELVGESFLELGSSDVAETVAQIQAGQPDVILNAINGDSNTAFFSALREAGITPDEIPTISFSIGEAELRQLDAEAMTGDYAAWNYFQSIDSEENQQFVNSFREKYGPQRVVTDPMEAAYFGVKLWAQAIESAEGTETAEIRRALRNQRMHAPEGDVRIDPATQHTFKTPRIGKVQSDGQFEIVWTAAKPEPPIPYPTSRTTEQWKAYLHDLYSGWGNQWAAPATD